MSDTLIWISGATQGIGLGLAKNCPFPGAKIINISRRPHPDYETVTCDLTDPASWDAVSQDFAARLANFRGKRAIFIHNANYQDKPGIIGVQDQGDYRRSVYANVAASLVLGEAFVRACRPDFESGLVMLSSDSAALTIPGLATYCAAKVGVEHWCEVVRRERLQLGQGPWVVAVRPGAVITPTVLASANMDPKVFPGATRVKEGLKHRVDIDEAGRRIWAKLPPPPGISTISFGVDPATKLDRKFTDDQVLMVFPGKEV